MFDFEKNSVLDALDGVPTEFQGLYVQGADKKFTINPAVAGLVGAYTGMTKSLSAEQKLKTTANGEAAKTRVALKAIREAVQQKLGVTIEDDAQIGEILTGKVDELLSKVQGGEALKIDLQKLKDQFTKQVSEAVGAEKAVTQKMRDALDRYLIGQEATRALSDANVVSTDLLMPHVRSKMKVAQNGDDFVAIVVDGEGNTRINSKGQPMTVADLVAEMKTQPAYAPAFKSDTKSGSGAPAGGSKNAALPAGGNKADKTSTDKIAAGLASRAGGGRVG